jgi:hypothetical protein
MVLGAMRYLLHETKFRLRDIADPKFKLIRIGQKCV